MDDKELKDLLAKLERRNDARKAATALAGATVVLGSLVLIAPWIGSLMPHGATVATVPEVVAPPDSFAGLSLVGHAAVVYDLATDEILFDKNGAAQLPLASLTKLLTMYAASSALSDTSAVAMTERALRAEGDSGFALGETFAYEDVARLALVASSNDAAQAVAEAAAEATHTSNKELMAGAAAAVGLVDTYANNGTGLDESTSVSGGYGTAREIARLAGALLKTAPEIARATIEPSITIRSREGKTHTLKNTNPDTIHVAGLLLSKTGYTDLAGGNLAVVYDAGIGHPIAIVVLGSSRDGRFSDIEALVARTQKHFGGLPATH